MSAIAAATTARQHVVTGRPPLTIFNGEPETYWENDTGVVCYQFVCSLENTCGACLQYHMGIRNGRWGIPIHFGCNCHQEPIKKGAKAPHAFVDYRKLLEEMQPKMIRGVLCDQQVKAIGGACHTLLQKGLATWEDIVTKTRVRTLEEVVARNKLTIKQMVGAGIRPDIARRAYEDVHTPEQELIERHRRKLIAALEPGRIAQEVLVDELSKRLAARVVISPPPSSVPPASPIVAPPKQSLILPAEPPRVWQPPKEIPKEPVHIPRPLSPEEPIPPRPATIKMPLPSPAAPSELSRFGPPPPAPVQQQPTHVPAPLSPEELIPPRPPGKAVELAGLLKQTKVVRTRDGKVDVKVPLAPKPLPPGPSWPRAGRKGEPQQGGPAITVHGKVKPEHADYVKRLITGLPAEVLATLQKHGVKIAIAEKVSSANAKIAAERAPGHGPHATMQNAGACYSPRLKLVIIALTRKEGQSYQPVKDIGSVIAHEVAHAFVDVAGDPSGSKQFRAVYNKDAAALNHEQREAARYLLQPGNDGPEETLAEILAAILGAQRIPTFDVLDLFPITSEFVRQWLNRGENSS